MGWVKLDDEFAEHRKVDALPDGAFRLHVAAMCHAARALTDGFIPEDRPPRLMRKYRKSYVTDLIAAGLWEKATDGWVIHDYLEYNPSAEDELERRRKDRERKARERAKGSKNAGRGSDGQFQSESARDSQRDGPSDGGEESAPPSTATRPPTPGSNKSSSGEPLGVDPVEDDDRIEITAKAVTARLEQRHKPDVPARWRPVTLADQRKQAKTWFAEHPTATVGQAVAALDPKGEPTPPPAPPTVQPPDFVAAEGEADWGTGREALAALRRQRDAR